MEWTPLHEAVKLNDINNVNLMVQNKEYLNQRSGNNLDTPLHVAATLGNILCMEILIENGADLELVDATGRTPLWVALQQGRLLTAHILCEYGADVNATIPLDIVNSQIPPGSSLLHWAASVGTLAITIYLLSRGALANAMDAYKRNPLHVAVVSSRNVAVIEELMFHGADIDAVDAHGFTPRLLCKFFDPNEICNTVNFGVTTRESFKKKKSAVFMGLILSPVLIMLAGLASYFIFPLWGFIGVVLAFGGLVRKWKHLTFHKEGPFLASWIIMASIATSIMYWYHCVFELYESMRFVIVITCIMHAAFLYFEYKSFTTAPGVILGPKVTKKNVVNFLFDGMQEYDICPSCWIRRPIRSKHCSSCGVCRPAFDHCCPFTFNCIGWKNHWYFTNFMFLTVTLLVVVSSLMSYLLIIKGDSWNLIKIILDNLISEGPHTTLVLCMLFFVIHLFLLYRIAVDQCCTVVVLGYTINESVKKTDYTYLRGRAESPFTKGPWNNYLSLSSNEINYEQLYKLPAKFMA